MFEILLFSGKFDLVGHSHQLFHICIVMTTYEQLNAVHLEITDGINSIHRMDQPTFLETWGMLLLVMAANACVVYVFHFTVYRNLLEEGLNKKTDICDTKESDDQLSTKDTNSCHTNGSVITTFLSDLKSSPATCDSSVHLRSGEGIGDESPNIASRSS